MVELKKYDNVEDARSATYCLYDAIFSRLNSISSVRISADDLPGHFSEIKDLIKKYDNARRQAEEMKAERLGNFPEDMVGYLSGKVRDFLNNPKLEHNDRTLKGYDSFLEELELMRKGMA